MPSKFGGVAVQQPSQPQSRFGGIAVEAQPATQAQLNDSASLTGRQRRAKQFQTTNAIDPNSPLSAGEIVGGGVETLATIGSSIIAEPVAGIVGSVASILPGESGAGAEAVRKTKEALTFQPRTRGGQRGIKALAGAVEPLAKAVKAGEDFLGDTVLESTGSPALAAAAKTLPTAVMEALGVGSARKSAKAITGLQKTPKVARIQKVSGKDVDRALLASAPDIEKLKDTSRAIYNEIDGLDVQLKPGAYKSFTGRVLGLKKKLRVNKRRTPEAFGVMQEFSKDFATPSGRGVADLEELRQIASQLSASSSVPDASIGAKMLDEIDDFMDNIPSGAFTGPGATEAAKIGPRYKAARSVWGKARRSELISEAMEKAGRQATGFENGVRNQLRAILNNKKRSRFFTKEELGAMDDVVQGTTEQNITKLVGRLGFSEGQATNILGGLGGTALGASFGGPIGAAAVNTIGQLARKRAASVTSRNASLSDALVRSKGNAKEIVNAYLKSTPKSKRKASELSDILTDPEIDVSDLLDSANALTRSAAETAAGRKIFHRAQIAGAAAPAALRQEEE